MARKLHRQTGETQTAGQQRQSSKCPLSPKDSTEMCKQKAQNRATKGSCLWHLWFEDPVQWLESCTVRPDANSSSRQSSKCPVSPKDSTEMCKEKAHNRATKGSCFWHLWFEDPVQWLESCTVRPERRKQQVNNASLPSAPCHPKIQRRCASKRHRTVRLKAVVSGISGLKIQCNGSKAAPSDRRDANSRSTTPVFQVPPVTQRFNGDVQAKGTEPCD